jgi:hypothetical protein
MIKSIDLSEVQNNKFVKYTTHNVQVAPNGKTVLVTANVERGGMGENESAEAEDVSDGLFDKIFIIDPLSDTIIGSLPIEIDSHDDIVSETTSPFQGRLLALCPISPS